MKVITSKQVFIRNAVRLSPVVSAKLSFDYLSQVASKHIDIVFVNKYLFIIYYSTNE